MQSFRLTLNWTGFKKKGGCNTVCPHIRQNPTIPGTPYGQKWHLMNCPQQWTQLVRLDNTSLDHKPEIGGKTMPVWCLQQSAQLWQDRCNQIFKLYHGITWPVLNEWQKTHSSSNKPIGVRGLFNSVVAPMSLYQTCFADTLLSLYENAEWLGPVLFRLTRRWVDELFAASFWHFDSDAFIIYSRKYISKKDEHIYAGI